MATYSFVWDPTERRLLNVYGCTGTGEDYVFGYPQSGVTLTSPFAPYKTFGSVKVLQSITDGLGRAHQFQYGSANSAELSQVTFPYGGILAWTYQNASYPGGRIQREAGSRTANWDGTNKTSTLTNDGNAGLFVHSWVKLTDSGGQKQWDFETTDTLTEGCARVPRAFGRGQPDLLAKQLGVRFRWGGACGPDVRDDTERSGATVRVADEDDAGTRRLGQCHADIRLQRRQCLLRTYKNTYATDSGHAARTYINLLTSSPVTNGTATTTHAQTNTWDGYGQNPAGPSPHSLDLSPGATTWMAPAGTYRGNLTHSYRPDGWTCMSYNQVDRRPQPSRARVRAARRHYGRRRTTERRRL